MVSRSPVRPSFSAAFFRVPRAHSLHIPALDDPHKVVKVIAQDGKTGDQTDVSYTNCKVIGNGSFGIVFQARLVGGPHEGEDIAIKKVLQDKRFKVRLYMLRLFF